MPSLNSNSYLYLNMHGPSSFTIGDISYAVIRVLDFIKILISVCLCLIFPIIPGVPERQSLIFTIQAQ